MLVGFASLIAGCAKKFAKNGLIDRFTNKSPASSGLILIPAHLANKLDQHHEAKAGLSFPSLFRHLPFFPRSCRHLFQAVPVFHTAAVSNVHVALPDMRLCCCPLLVMVIPLLQRINTVSRYIPSGAGRLVSLFEWWLGRLALFFFPMSLSVPVDVHLCLL